MTSPFNTTRKKEYMEYAVHFMKNYFKIPSATPPNKMRGKCSDILAGVLTHHPMSHPLSILHTGGHKCQLG